MKKTEEKLVLKKDVNPALKTFVSDRVLKHPMFLFDGKNLALSDILTHVLDFAKVDKEAVAKGFLAFINSKDTKTTNKLTYEESLDPVKGMLAPITDSPYEVFTPWMIIGYILSRTPDQLRFDRENEERSTRLATLFSGFITDARVIFTIDQGEHLFDSYGYLGGGDFVYNALINEERAKRIPRTNMNSQVLAWCFLAGFLKKEDIPTLPEGTVRSIYAEDPGLFELLSADQQKMVMSMNFNVSSENLIDKLLKKKKLVDDDLKGLTTWEKQYLFYHCSIAALEGLSRAVFTEALMFVKDQKKITPEQLSLLKNVCMPNTYLFHSLFERFKSSEDAVMFVRANKPLLERGRVALNLVTEAQKSLPVLHALLEIHNPKLTVSREGTMSDLAMRILLAIN